MIKFKQNRLLLRDKKKEKQILIKTKTKQAEVMSKRNQELLTIRKRKTTLNECFEIQIERKMELFLGYKGHWTGQ